MPEIIMPKMGDAMTEGKVIRWYRKVGETIKKGEALLEIETDKVNLDLEAEDDGVLEAILVDAGGMADVGVALGLVGDGTGSVLAERSLALSDEKRKPVEAVEPATRSRTEFSARQSQDSDGRVRSTPLARKMAREMGVDLSRLSGSGPAGRVIAADVKTSAQAGLRPHGSIAKSIVQSALADEEIPLSAMRRTIARRLSESIGPVPHFFLTIEVDVTELLSLRSQLNAIQPVKTSVNDFIVRAAALAMHSHPDVNASFAGESIRRHGAVNIGVAVATSEGLITPVIRNADERSIPDIAAAVKELAERARNRKLRPDEYQGSTFTISNLGMYGIDEFTAIINPPNAGILAVGSAAARPAVVDRQIVIRDQMKLTMSCDHRVIDGAAGARFMATLREFLEQPLRLLL